MTGIIEPPTTCEERERRFGSRGNHTDPGSVLHNEFMLVDARYRKGIEECRR